ncbi:hypothetical protein LTR53_019830, partial [Teratosphaeriaceae sp. CCFEE 6253]
MAIVADGAGVSDVLARAARTYGIDLVGAGRGSGAAAPALVGFGNEALKAELLTAVMAFCEASPDPHGVVRAATTLLRCVTTPATVERGPGRAVMAVPRDVQIRLTTTISRAVAVSRHLGLPGVEAQFWDDFL